MPIPVSLIGVAVGLGALLFCAYKLIQTNEPTKYYNYNDYPTNYYSDPIREILDDARKEKARKRRKENSTIDSCTICLEILSDNITKTQCGHTFHKACLSKWLCEKKLCPICRSDIVL